MNRPLFTGALGLAAAVALGAPSLAQEPLTLEDLFEIRQVSGIDISPDGEQVAFTLSIPRNVVAGEDDGTPQSELYIASGPDAARLYVSGESYIGGADWSPDGDAITFLTNRDGDTGSALYQIPVDGGQARRIFAGIIFRLSLTMRQPQVQHRRQLQITRLPRVAQLHSTSRRCHRCC